jgi:hypothetical protein
MFGRAKTVVEKLPAAEPPTVRGNERGDAKKQKSHREGHGGNHVYG